MTDGEFQALPLGLYRVYWRSGGSSLAAIGMSASGGRWLAPCNWLEPVKEFNANRHWASISHVTMLFSTQELRAWEEAGQ